MSWKDKMKTFIDRQQNKIDEGREVLIKRRKVKDRRRLQEAKLAEPGTIRYGLLNRQSPTDFMQSLYEKKKYDREIKNKKL